MSTQDEFSTLSEEKREKMARINDLMRKIDALSEEHALPTRFDRESGEWSPEKETYFTDFNEIEEEIARLEMEIAG